MVHPATPDTLRRRRLHNAPATPLVTCYDAAGARTELSSASFDNAVAKTANLMLDELGLGAGSVVALMLPLHWWQPVWFASCAAVGAIVAVGGDPARADLAVCAPGGLDQALAAPEVVACRLDPWGRPFDEPLPPGVLDHAAASRPHGDRFPPSPGAADPASPLLRTGDGAVLSNGDVSVLAARIAAAAGLADGGRLLTTADPATVEGALAALTASLTVQGSVVLCADPERADAVAAAERVTARIG